MLGGRLLQRIEENKKERMSVGFSKLKTLSRGPNVLFLL